MGATLYMSWFSSNKPYINIAVQTISYKKYFENFEFYKKSKKLKILKKIRNFWKSRKSSWKLSHWKSYWNHIETWNSELQNPKFGKVVFFVELGSTRHCDQTELIYILFTYYLLVIYYLLIIYWLFTDYWFTDYLLMGASGY